MSWLDGDESDWCMSDGELSDLDGLEVDPIRGWWDENDEGWDDEGFVW